MARGGLSFTVDIKGADEVIRAFGKLPKDAETELRAQAFDIAKVLADRIKAAGRADSPVAGRAASTVREVRGDFPTVQASNTGRARGRKPSKKGGGVLFASEFGQNRRSGWYANPRYRHSVGRQFKPHRGAGSYWFFVTAERMQPYIESEWGKVADAVVRKWSA
jgi:hypothetical protein